MGKITIGLYDVHNCFDGDETRLAAFFDRLAARRAAEDRP
jgi:hypothetical protein